jgi:hypothetical protein
MKAIPKKHRIFLVAFPGGVWCEISHTLSKIKVRVKNLNQPCLPLVGIHAGRQAFSLWAYTNTHLLF